jgi:hypothetical protein
MPNTSTASFRGQSIVSVSLLSLNLLNGNRKVALMFKAENIDLMNWFAVSGLARKPK